MKKNNNLKEELKDIDRNDLDQIMANSIDSAMYGYAGYGKTVPYNKDSLVNLINSHFAKHRENSTQVEEKVESAFVAYHL